MNAPDPDPASRDPLVVRLLRRLCGAVYAYPRLFFYPQVLLTVACLFYTIEKIQFSTNRNDLVGADKQYHRNFLRYKQEFQGQDDLVAVVESGDQQKNRQFVERLGARLEAETNLFADVFFKGDLKLMGPKALLFVTNETVLVEMGQRLGAARPVLESFSQATNLNSLFRLVIRQFREAGNERDDRTDALIQALPALGRIAAEAADCVDRPGTPPSPGVTALFDGGDEAEQSMYITFATNRIYVVTARAAREDLNGDAVERLRALVQETQAEVPGVNVGITGEPVLEVDEMAQSQVDTMVATVVSLVLCALLFISGYKETGRPVKATICLVVGLIYTLGFTTLTVGHLNILTITFLPILIGLGIDFGIHLVTRYEEELRRGRPERVAIELAMANTGKGIVTGCLTTAGAFLAMRFTDFRGIEEMGLISGGGLILCMLTMLTLLPVLLLRGRQNVLDHQPQVAVDRRARIERLWLERPGWVAGITLTLCLLAAGQAGRVYFDYNLLHMQSEGLPAVKFEEKLIKAATKSVLFGAVIAESPEQAIELERKLRRLPSVSDVDSVAGFLAADATRQMALIREVKKQVAGIRLPEADPEPVNLAELRLTLQTLQAYLSLGAKGAAREGEAKLSDELRQVRAAMARLRARLGGADPEAAAEKLGAFQRALFNDLRDTILTLQQQDDRAPLRPEDLPLPLRHRFVGASGHRYLLQVTPKFDVWERKTQEAFVKDLRRVDERATGTPVQLYEYTELLKNSYEEAALYALGAIVILVFLQFRNLVCVALALLPVALGTLWLVGWMGWTGLPFNPANIMTLPLVIGVGVTNGIHILTRFAEEQNPGILARSTGKAVLLSALTTVAGFGSLMPAKHQGIASLGTLMALGTTTCMIAGLTFLPALLNWLGRRGWLAPLTGLQMKPKP